MPKICRVCGEWDPCRCPIPTALREAVLKKKEKSNDSTRKTANPTPARKERG